MPSSQATQTEAEPAEAVDSDGLPAGERLSLQEMTRIMDVAATLRKERALVDQQLNIDQIKLKLRERLLEAAKVSGDPVTAAEIDAAIDQYYDRLHEFQEPSVSLATFLAHAWVRRGPILKIVLAGIVIVAAILAWAGFSAARQSLRAENLWLDAARSRDAIIQWEEGQALAQELNAQVEQSALARDARDFQQLERIAANLHALQAEFDADYTVEILGRAGEPSGTQRNWTDERGTRTSGFFVFVEARDKNGNPVKAPIYNRETDRTELVSRWGEQVPEDIFDRLAADKEADGVLDERTFGVKRRGTRRVEVTLPDADGTPVSRQGQITSW